MWRTLEYAPTMEECTNGRRPNSRRPKVMYPNKQLLSSYYCDVVESRMSLIRQDSQELDLPATVRIPQILTITPKKRKKQGICFSVVPPSGPVVGCFDGSEAAISAMVRSGYS